MQLTVRSYTDETRKLLLDGIRQLTEDVCRTFGCPKPPTVVVRDEFTPAAYNDPDLTAAAVGVFKEVFGADKLAEMPKIMGGEDFGRYAARLQVPGLQIWLGSISEAQYEAATSAGGRPLLSLHTSTYVPVAEPTLRTGVQAMSTLAIALMAGGS